MKTRELHGQEEIFGAREWDWSQPSSYDLILSLSSRFHSILNCCGGSTQQQHKTIFFFSFSYFSLIRFYAELLRCFEMFLEAFYLLFCVCFVICRIKLKNKTVAMPRWCWYKSILIKFFGNFNIELHELFINSHANIFKIM